MYMKVKITHCPDIVTKPGGEFPSKVNCTAPLRLQASFLV